MGSVFFWDKSKGGRIQPEHLSTHTYQRGYFCINSSFLWPFVPQITDEIYTMSILLPTITEEKLAKKNAIKLNITDWWDQTVDDNLRVDLFFQLSNSGCALCHSVLSHTKWNKRTQHESETGSLQRCFCYCSHIASTTWNRGLTWSDQQLPSCLGSNEHTRWGNCLQSIQISPEEELPEAKKKKKERNPHKLRGR